MVGCVIRSVQSKLFPLYFWLSVGSSLLALSTLYYSGTGILRPQALTLGKPRGRFDLSMMFAMQCTVDYQ